MGHHHAQPGEPVEHAAGDEPVGGGDEFVLPPDAPVQVVGFVVSAEARRDRERGMVLLPGPRNGATISSGV